MIFKPRLLVIGLILAGLTALPVLAEDNSLPQLVDELKALKAKAAKERAADPWLLQDLDKLIDRYAVSTPALNTLLSEDFTQSTYRLKRKWSVLSGKAWTDTHSGLNLQAQFDVAQQQQAPAQQSSEDMGAAIIGAILQEALEIEPSKQPEPNVGAEEITPAEVVKRVNVPQTFVLQTRFSAQNRDYREVDVSFSLFQSNRANNGYQLVVSGQHEIEISLIKVLSGRATTLKTVSLRHAVGSTQNRLSWEQNARGEHVVYLNDQLVLKTRTKVFRQAFKEFAILSQGRQIAIPFVSIDG